MSKTPQLNNRIKKAESAQRILGWSQILSTISIFFALPFANEYTSAFYLIPIFIFSFGFLFKAYIGIKYRASIELVRTYKYTWVGPSAVPKTYFEIWMGCTVLGLIPLLFLSYGGNSFRMYLVFISVVSFVIFLGLSIRDWKQNNEKYYKRENRFT